LFIDSKSKEAYYRGSSYYKT